MNDQGKQPSSFLSSIVLGGACLAAIGSVGFLIWIVWSLTSVPPEPFQRVVKKKEVGRVVAKATSDPTSKPVSNPVSNPIAKTKSDSASGVVSIAEGARLYNANCMACHQPEGKGKVGFAPYIRNPHFLAVTSDDYLRKSILHGRPGTAMVGWSHLKPNEVDSVVAYLRSAADPKIKPVVTIDATRKHPGTAAGGKMLYGQYCATCHGVQATGYAEGGPGPAIGNAGFLAVASDDYIFQTIKHGRVGTAMRPFSGARGLANLSDGEIGDIVAYLRHRSDAPPAVVEVGIPNPVKGKMHFDANCAACHQPNGAGRPGIAPSIGNRDFLAIASDKFIKDTVRKGRPGTSMVQRPDLSDAVLSDIVAYLRGLPVETAVTIKVDDSKKLASLGDSVTGHEKFGRYCAACHGPEGQGYAVGGAGPGIGLPGFLGSASDDYIFQTLKLGRINTAMRPFLGASGLANLSEQDAYDIISYMRSLSSQGQ